MKLITYTHLGSTSIGAVIDQRLVVPLTSLATTMLDFIQLGAEGLRRAGEHTKQFSGGLELDEVTLQAPIPRPARNIMCLGKNYAAHAEESYRARGEKAELPAYPLFFTKATTAVTGPFAPVPYDPQISTEIDYEAELAVIIGREGRNISRDEALTHVYGYTVMNDITARDLQQQHKQFFKGKSLDGSAPLGPWIVTADEITDPQNLRITCTVNGELRQDSNTSLMIFDIAETIAQLSRGMTLLAGDIIATGTPAGVGFARTPPSFLKPGDEVTCTVEGIGAIRNLIAK